MQKAFAATFHNFPDNLYTPAAASTNILSNHHSSANFDNLRDQNFELDASSFLNHYSQNQVAGNNNVSGQLLP